jgi:hypothetical protein
LDDGNLRSLQDITRPKLFPDYEWHSKGQMGHLPENTSNHSDSNLKPAPSSTTAAKQSASAVYLINKSREFQDRFQNSAFYVRPTLEADVVRYGKRPRQYPLEDGIIRVLEHMGQTADPRYIPPELLKVSDWASTHEFGLDDGIGPKRSLDDLAAAESKQHRTTGEEGAAGVGAADDEENLSDVHDAEEDEEEDADYTTNYYASDNDSDRGDDGGDEAVF